TDAAGEVRTGRSLGDRTEALGRGLTALGLSGRRGGLWYWNSVAAIEAHLAVEWIGATKVPVDPGAPTAEARAVFAAPALDAVPPHAPHPPPPPRPSPAPTSTTPISPSPPPAPPAPAPWRSSGSQPTAPPSSIPA